MNNKTYIFIFLIQLTFSSASYSDQTDVNYFALEIKAQCVFPHQPEINPDKNYAEKEIRALRAVVVRYLKRCDDYLNCIQKIENGLGEDITEEQKAVIIAFHNQAVELMHQTGDRYNSLLKIHNENN